ncbi:MAG: AAA family ATPase, partial [Acidimicrobiales bacterium]
MRIEQLDLQAYGHYGETVLDLGRLEHGVTVVYGPNEAGKSTARRAVVAALFGIERVTADAHRYGPHGLRLGATLRATDGTVCSFVRHGLSGLAQRDGAPLGEADLDHFRGGVDRRTYDRLFAVDHEELRRGSESLLEADGEIGRLVFGASLGSGSVSAVLARLDDRVQNLYRDRGSAQRIPKALKAYQEGMKQARASRVRARDWERLRQDVELADRHVDEARAAFTAAQAAQRRMEQLKAAKPLIDRRRHLLDRLDELGPAPPAEWAARARESVDAYRRARESRDRASSARTRLASEVGRITVPTALLDVAEDVEELVKNTGRYRKDIGDLPARRGQLEGALDAVREQLERLGKEKELVADSDLTELERLARRYAALETGERAAAEELDRATEKAAQV